MGTKYHIYQQFVEFRRVSVNTDAFWGETSRDARLLADSKAITGTYHSAICDSIVQIFNGLALPFG